MMSNKKREEWGAVINDTDFFLIEMLQIILLQYIRISTNAFKNFQKWYKNDSQCISGVKYYRRVTQKSFFMKHRNNFHRGVSGTVYFAIILSGATAKDNIPIPSLSEPVPFQILFSGPQTHGLSREHQAHPVITAVMFKFPNRFS